MFASMRRNRSAHHGDEATFEALMQNNFGDVWKFVRRRCANAGDADDVTAEVFATAWRRRADLPRDDEQRLWLFGAARLVLANHHRSTRRQNNLRLRLVQTATSSGSDEHEHDGRLAEALAELPEADRDVLIMRAWDELAVTDIAELLDCTPNAASLRLHKARGRLAKILEQKDRVRGGHMEIEPTAEERR